MRLQVIAAGSTHLGVVPGFGVPDAVAAPPATYGGWRPRTVLGADSPGGLVLPQAVPDGPADAVLGQPDFTLGTEFPYVSQAGRLRFPYGLTAVDGGLGVADTANNRVLVYSATDVTHDRRPDAVLGQPTEAANGENRWEAVAPDTLCWPYGLHWHRDPSAGRDLMAVADSGNNRVVLWERR